MKRIKKDLLSGEKKNPRQGVPVGDGLKLIGL